jgi:hypothetical protein
VFARGTTVVEHNVILTGAADLIGVARHKVDIPASACRFVNC